MSITPEEQRIKRIEIKTRRLSNHLFSGDYHTAFKGRGMSFSEVRAYSFGDDVRNIDWNVTARSGIPHIKVFEEERELTVMLLLDVSGSTFFGTGKQTRNELMAEIAGVLAFSAISNNDKVGVIFFSDQIEGFVPPRKGRQHILRIFNEILTLKPKGRKTNPAVAFEYLTQVMKKRSIAFVISDFMTSKPYETPLRICARKHELIGIRLFDPVERKLPAAGLMRVEDQETGETRWVDTSSPVVQKAVATRYEQQSAYYNRILPLCGADPLSVDISEEEAYVKELVQFFKRGKRG